MIFKSFVFSVIAVVIGYLTRTLFHTNLFLTDVGGLSAFVTVFGTLYGILTAFVVFEVWNQYNQTSGLIDNEAQGLERLYRLTLYFRDTSLTKKMELAIKSYSNLVIEGKFQALGNNERNIKNGIAFRKISKIIRDVEFDDNHDAIIYSQILEHYGNLAQIRTERQNQSLTRLPTLLKTFIYLSSLFALFTFLVMPFSNQYYGFLSIAIISFIQAMIFQIIEDLDNPFVGNWNLTPEPFKRALKHIEDDYS